MPGDGQTSLTVWTEVSKLTNYSAKSMAETMAQRLNDVILPPDGFEWFDEERQAVGISILFTPRVIQKDMAMDWFWLCKTMALNGVSISTDSKRAMSDVEDGVAGYVAVSHFRHL